MRSLDGKHTAFGELVGDNSMATLRDLQKYGAPSNPGIPIIPLLIDQATISIE